MFNRKKSKETREAEKKYIDNIYAMIENKPETGSIYYTLDAEDRKELKLGDSDLMAALPEGISVPDLSELLQNLNGYLSVISSVSDDYMTGQDVVQLLKNGESQDAVHQHIQVHAAAFVVSNDSILEWAMQPWDEASKTAASDFVMGLSNFDSDGLKQLYSYANGLLTVAAKYGMNRLAIQQCIVAADRLHRLHRKVAAEKKAVAGMEMIYTMLTPLYLK